MGINAVKGVEIGAGFAAAALSGEDNADEMRIGNDGRPRFLSNNAGGILGGISTGQPIVARFAVKPTSSILTPRRTVDRYGRETEIATKGRHDPCVGIRAVPVGEAMMACVLADHYLRHRGQVGATPRWPLARPNAHDARPMTPDPARGERRSPPLPAARSWWSPTTTTARTRAICSSPPACARRRRWPSSFATPPASSARHCRPRRRSACISTRWWRSMTPRSAPRSPSRSTCGTA